MIRILSILLFLLTGAVMAEWHDDAAKFRLEIKPEKPGKVLMLDLHAMIFPSSLKNGVTVYSGAGKKISHRLDKDSHNLFCEGVPENEKMFVYFGFDGQRPFDCWNESELGKIPEKYKLRLRQTNSRLENISETEMHANDTYRKYLQIKEFEVEAFHLEQELKAMSNKLEDARNVKQDTGEPSRQPEKDGVQPATAMAQDPAMESLSKKLYDASLDLAQMKASLLIRTKMSNIPDAELRKFRDRERENEKNQRPGGTPENTAVKKVFIDKSPSSKDKSFSGRFIGTLLINEPGVYSFAINSRDASHLVIDDNLVVSWPYRHEKSEDWEKSGDIYLDAGLHDFSFFFCKSKGKAPYAAAAWKKPGEQEYRILEENDFSPAYRASILSCANKNGDKFPIVKYEINGHFFIDRDRKADWLDCKVDMAGEKFTPVWKVGMETVSGEEHVSLAPLRKSTIPISLSSKEKKFSDITLEIPEELLKESDSKLIENDIMMKLVAPHFIFDDESLEMSLEVISALPMETRVLLKTLVDHANPIFRENSSWIDIEPRKSTEADPYSQRFIKKKKFDLRGDCLGTQQLRIRFILSVPPFVITEENFRFIPLLECRDLKYDAAGFFADPQGKRVIPVLHRPTLAEKRSWSFAESFIEELSHTDKILVIADDFENNGRYFSKRMGELLEKNNTGLDFVPWKKTDDAPSMATSLGTVLRRIAETDADRIVIIPSAWDTSMGTSSRLQLRILSAIIQMAQSNKAICSIALATPYPLLQDNPIADELSKGIRQELKKDFAVEDIIDLNQIIRTKTGWKDTYRRDASSPTLYAPFPIHLMDDICQMIIDSD